jgi:AcrR family transcriptional regulator
MNEKRSDRRIHRTKNALRNAFQELISEKEYDQVTVEEITDRANLGRTTFYLHYKDKEDLLLENFTELFDDMVHEVSQTPVSAWQLDIWLKDSEIAPVKPNLLVFQHVAENAELYRIVLHGEGALKVIERLRSIIISAVNAMARSKIEQEGVRVDLKIPLEVLANYYAGSLLGLINWWLENDMPFTAEEMKEMFNELFKPGLLNVLGMDQKR